MQTFPRATASALIESRRADRRHLAALRWGADLPDPVSYYEGPDAMAAAGIASVITPEGPAVSAYLRPADSVFGQPGRLVFSEATSDRMPTRVDYVHELIHLGQDRRSRFVGYFGELDNPTLSERRYKIAVWEIDRIERMLSLRTIRWTAIEQEVLKYGAEVWQQWLRQLRESLTPRERSRLGLNN